MLFDQRLDAVDQRLDSVDENITSLREAVENNATEFRSHFKHIESKLDQHEDMFAIVVGDLRGVKFDIEHLSE